MYKRKDLDHTITGWRGAELLFWDSTARGVVTQGLLGDIEGDLTTGGSGII